jgi:hypothetical protein
MPVPRLIVLGRLGDFLGAPLVRYEALAFRNDLWVLGEEVECLQPDHITGQ